MVDGREGNGIHVDARRTTSDAVVQVQERALVAPLAVDEYQHLIRSQAAQRRGPYGVGTISDGRTWKVERWDHRFDDLRRLGVAAGRDLAACDDVDRCCLHGVTTDRAGSDRDFLREGERERHVSRDRRRVGQDVDDLRRETQPVYPQLDAITTDSRPWHVQRVLTSRVGRRGHVRIDDRHHRTGNGNAIRASRD
jgi:hypothetical protein